MVARFRGVTHDRARRYVAKHESLESNVGIKNMKGCIIGARST